MGKGGRAADRCLCRHVLCPHCGTLSGASLPQPFASDLPELPLPDLQTVETALAALQAAVGESFDFELPQLGGITDMPPSGFPQLGEDIDSCLVAVVLTAHAAGGAGAAGAPAAGGPGHMGYFG
eukprot:Hpha_TRINITY_DN1838_c0_g2::TRINITY_DN1838_c0_g2_i1::g.170574::m.170574